jgi:hypothetical protein
MTYLVKDKKLKLKYMPGKGAWTYHLEIPGTKSIRGKWGEMKVSGSIDGYQIENLNLAPIKGANKIISINGTIRKAINKSGGDFVTVTLYMKEQNELIDKGKIIASFQDGGVMTKFEELSKENQEAILKEILSRDSQEKQIDLIVKHIEKLS